MKNRNLVKFQSTELELIASENELLEIRGGKSVSSLLEQGLQGGSSDHNDNCNCHCQTGNEHDQL